MNRIGLCRAGRFALIALVLAPVPVSAHDPFEITGDLRWRADGVDVHLTMAWSTMRRLLAGGSEPKTWIPPERFTEVQPQIQAHAAGFLVLSAGGARLVPRRVQTALTVEDDVEILLEFAADGGGRSRLHLEAAMLSTLALEGYGVTLNSTDAHGRHVERLSLTLDQPDCVMAVPELSPADR